MNGSENIVDWNWDMESNGQALLRIAAILFGFAMLAERLGSQPVAVRRLVLAILRSAESVAREFIAGQAGAGYSTYPPGRFSDDAAEATRLAQSFRALASALDVLCSILVCAVRRPADGDIERDAGLVCHWPPHRATGHARLCPDTS